MVHIIRDEFEQEPYTPDVLNPQEGFRYKLVNKHERNFARKLSRGYEVVKDSDPEKLTMTDRTPLKKGVDLDTTQQFNDTVLMRIPQEIYDRLMERKAKILKHRTGLIVNQFENDTSGMGFNPKRDGKTTRYAAGMDQEEWDTNPAKKALEEKYGKLDKEE